MTINADSGKGGWRRLVSDMFRLIPRESRRRLDATLTERVGDFVFRADAGFLLAFAPMPDEPDLSPFFRRWIKEGGALALPVWLGGEKMLIRRITDLDNQVGPGRGGILEPVPECAEVSPSELSLVVTPGRAFSESCDRLGRGAGCYDALFRANPGLSKVGVAYDFQIVPELPLGEMDVPVDAVITPTRIVGEV